MMSDLESRVAGTNGQHSIYERGRYLATVNDRETADRIIAALVARATDRAEVERLRAALVRIRATSRTFTVATNDPAEQVPWLEISSIVNAALAAAPDETTEG
jgi:hypothetical protein